MGDKSLGIWLIVVFALPGAAVLLLAWFWPALAEDRGIAIVVGSTGLLLAALQLFLFFRPSLRAEEKQAMIKVKTEERM